MKRVLITATTVCALAACGSSVAASGQPASSVTSPSAQAAAARCGPHRARTLATSRTARVYVRGQSVYGCATGGHGRYLLGRSSLCIGSARVGVVTVADRVAAFALTRCGIDTASTTVEVRRLTDNALLYSHDAADAAGPEGFVSVGSIVATSKGAAAWIASASSIVSHHTVMGVYARRGDGVQTLDTGSGIVANSLQLKDSGLSWQDGSQRDSAHLS